MFLRFIVLRHMVLHVSLVVWIANLSYGAIAMEPPTLAAMLVTSQRVLVIAHRGDSKVAPENTLPAFTSAVTVGADLVELDYFHSADGVLVVFHDKQLDRTTDAARVFDRGDVSLASKNLSQLRRLDAGSWFDARFAGTRIPTLDEAIDEIQKGSITLIEHKAGDAAACIKLLNRKNVLGEVVVQSFDWQYVAQCHRLAPCLTVAALGKEKLTEKMLDDIQRTGASVVGWNHKQIHRREIEAIHRRGLKAWVYTVDDPQRAGQLIDEGIDGIITNTPAALLKLIGSRQ